MTLGGYRRAAWHSFDRLDNRGVPSARVIVPELQDLQVGDVLATDRDGTGFLVEAVDSPSSRLLTEAGHVVMIWWMLTGIRARAEQGSAGRTG